MEYRGWNSFLAAQFTPSLASLFLKADRRAQKIGFTGGRGAYGLEKMSVPNLA